MTNDCTYLLKTQQGFIEAAIDDPLASLSDFQYKCKMEPGPRPGPNHCPQLKRFQISLMQCPFTATVLPSKSN